MKLKSTSHHRKTHLVNPYFLSCHNVSHCINPTTASPHHAAPTKLYFNPSPSPQPPITGPTLTAAWAILDPTPFTVARTLGFGTQLLRMMADPGLVNVRETAFINMDTPSAIQTGRGRSGTKTMNGVAA